MENYVVYQYWGFYIEKMKDFFKNIYVKHLEDYEVILLGE